MSTRRKAEEGSNNQEAETNCAIECHYRLELGMPTEIRASYMSLSGSEAASARSSQLLHRSLRAAMEDTFVASSFEKNETSKGKRLSGIYRI